MRASVLIHRTAAEERPHRVAVPLRIAQTLQDEHQRAFAAHVAIRGRIERAAPALRREHPRAREGCGEIGREYHIHAAHQRDVTGSGAKAFTPLMHGHERRRAGRIDGPAGTAEIEEIRQPVRHDTGRIPGGAMRFRRATARGREPHVITGADAHEDAGACTRKRRRCHATALERFPGDFTQEPLLRIHQPRFVRGNAEAGGIEARDIGEVATFAEGRLAR